jgi:hypothetical protein
MKQSDVGTHGEAALAKAVKDLVSTNRAYTVTIESVDDDYAYVSIGGGEAALPVPLTNISIKNAAFKIKPNVGSLAIIQYADGDEARPFFVSYSEIDFFSFTRGGTTLSWEITPPERDSEGEEIEGETNDVVNLSIGESTLKVNKDVWEFNGGTLGGMAIVANLVEKYNDLKTAFDSFKSNYNAHIHPLSTGTSSPTLSQETTVIATVTVEDIQNDKITQ